MFRVTYRIKCLIYTTMCLYHKYLCLPFASECLSVISFLDHLDSILPHSHCMCFVLVYSGINSMPSACSFVEDFSVISRDLSLSSNRSCDSRIQEFLVAYVLE